MLYLDTCVLLAVLMPEVHSAVAAAFLEEASAPLAISSWSVTELHSALGLKVQIKALSQAQAETVLQGFERSLAPGLLLLEQFLVGSAAGGRMHARGHCFSCLVLGRWRAVPVTSTSSPSTSWSPRCCRYGRADHAISKADAWLWKQRAVVIWDSAAPVSGEASALFVASRYRSPPGSPAVAVPGSRPG